MPFLWFGLCSLSKAKALSGSHVALLRVAGPMGAAAEGTGGHRPVSSSFPRSPGDTLQLPEPSQEHICIILWQQANFLEGVFGRAGSLPERKLKETGEQEARKKQAWAEAEAAGSQGEMQLGLSKGLRDLRGSEPLLHPSELQGGKLGPEQAQAPPLPPMLTCRKACPTQACVSGRVVI